ncbi:MAG: FlgD immunoglobulin-like domain containing protein [bacterium]
MHIKVFLYIQFAWLMLIFTCPESTAFGQSQWQKYVGNPVLSPEPQSGIIAFSDPALLFDGTTFHLWITGGGFIPGDTTAGVRTYYYTSTDGYSWQANSLNPVFREGPASAWDSGHIETPSVIRSGEEFWLYYSATPDSMADDGAQLKFGLATSQDGQTWTRHPANPILERGLPGSWEERQIESPCVLKTDSLFYMWYSGTDSHWNIHVGLATSADGINWQKYPGNPVFSPSRSSEWDSVGVYAPQVRWLENRFVMLYTGMVFSDTGYDFSNTKTGMAVSEDGINWTRASDQPVLSGTTQAWDASGPFTLDWIEANDQLLMSYVSDGKVGIAVSPIDVVHVNLDESKQPEEHLLFPNYPNPFNPTTTIQFQLPKTERVTLKIYNLLAQEVQTLVDEVKEPGIYKIMWNGKNRNGRTVSAGLYVLRLEAGEFGRSRKMIFLR